MTTIPGIEIDKNVAIITETAACIFKKSKFNGDISKWNVSNVTNMEYIFYRSPLEGNEPAWYKEK